MILMCNLVYVGRITLEDKEGEMAIIKITG